MIPGSLTMIDESMLIGLILGASSRLGARRFASVSWDFQLSRVRHAARVRQWLYPKATTEAIAMNLTTDNILFTVYSDD